MKKVAENFVFGAGVAATKKLAPMVKRPMRPAVPLESAVPRAPGNGSFAAKASLGNNIAATYNGVKAQASGVRDAIKGPLPLGYHPRRYTAAQRRPYLDAHANTRFAINNPGFALTQAGLGAQRAVHSPMGQLATNIAMPG